MSADKYPSIFSRQMEAIVYISFIYFRVVYLLVFWIDMQFHILSGMKVGGLM